MRSIQLTVNGSEHELEVEPRELLVYVLREASRAHWNERWLRHVLVRSLHCARQR